jgi:hypothetical protein
LTGVAKPRATAVFVCCRKRFDDNKWYKGTVEIVDTEVELDDGSIERLGPYYYIQ